MCISNIHFFKAGLLLILIRIWDIRIKGRPKREHAKGRVHKVWGAHVICKANVLITPNGRDINERLPVGRVIWLQQVADSSSDKNKCIYSKHITGTGDVWNLWRIQSGGEVSYKGHYSQFGVHPTLDLLKISLSSIMAAFSTRLYTSQVSNVTCASYVLWSDISGIPTTTTDAPDW